MSSGKAFGDIRHTIKVNIVEHNEFVVTRRDNVLFKIICPHCIREGLTGQRMFGQVT